MNARAFSKGGFSLIEALVALIVASMALLAVYELQRQLVRGQARYERALALAAVQENALVLLREVNPTAEPSGQRTLGGGRTLRWRSTPIAAPQPNVKYPAGTGSYELRLYRVDADLLDGQRRPLGRLTIERLGWRRLETITAARGRPRG